MQFKELGSLFEKGELATLINGGGLKSNNFKTASSISDMQNITAEMFNKQFRINVDGISEFSKAQIEAKANAIGLTDSLKNEVLAMASDASMTDKLKTGKLTWTKAIDIAGDEIQSVSDALKNSGKISEDWILKIDKAKPEKLKQTLKDCVNDVDGLADSFTSLGEVEKASTSSLGDGLKGMLVSLKAMLPVIAAVGAAIAVYKAWDYTQTGFTRAQEKFENALSNYKNTKSEIESLNSELDNTKSRIEELKELQDNGVITFAEEVELEKLQHTNDELERQLEIKTKLAEAQAKIVAENAKAASSKEQSYTENQREKYGTILGTLKSIGDTIFAPTKQYTDSNGNVTFDSEKHHWKDENNYDTSITSQFTSNIKKLSDAKKELSEIEKKLTDNPQDKLQLKNQKEQLKNIEEITSALSSQYDTIQGWVESSTDDYGNALKGSESYVKQWKDAINEYVNMGKTKNEQYLNNLENYFSSSKSGSSMKDYLVSLAKDGKSAEEALEAFRASGMRLKDIGVSENAFVRYFEDIKREAQEADEAVRSVDGTFDGLKKSFESENQGANYDTTMGYYKTAKEMYKNGLVGTDDFKSMAQFGVGYDIAKKLKDNADAYTYASDAYVEAWEQSQALLERWYGNEDELTNMTNVLNDFKDAGLASSLGDNEWTFKNDDGSMKFKTTAEAADKLNTSVSNVELAMSKLEEHGFEFDGIEKSGELLENYKNSLDQIKDVYDSMEDGAQKDRLKKLIEGYDSEYEKFQDDLSGLSEDQIVKIKFEYDLASIQQKIQELKSMAEASGSNQDQAALRVAQEQALGMLEGKTGVTKDSDEGYAQSYAKRTSLTKDMAGKSEEERAAINQEINALLELQNAFQQFKLDGGELDWNSFLDTPTATALFNDLIEKGTLTEKQIKELFGDSITCKIDAELNDNNLQKKLASLKTDEKITFEADVDDLDNAQVEAVKNQDGTIKYTANVAGVPKEVHKITEQDGTIRFTTEFDGSLDWINNNLKNGETITYKADVSGIQKDIEACKDENGTIHYYSVMDDGSKQELTQQTDKDGKITYVADTSAVEQATNETKNTVEKTNLKVGLTADPTDAYGVIASVKADAEKETIKLKGSVDLTNRPQVDAKKLKDVGWEDAGEGTATVFSSSYSNEKGDKTIVVTPILPNGDVLEPEALSNYAEGLLAGQVDTEGIGIRTYIGDDSIAQSDRYAESLHKVQEAYYLGDDAQKEALGSLSQYNALQLKSIDTSNMQSTAMGKSMSDLMNSLGIGTDSLQEFVDVLTDMNLIDSGIDVSVNAEDNASEVINKVSQEEISDKIVTLVGEDNASDVIGVWNTLSPEPKFAELSADDQASVAVEIWNGLSADPKFTELSAEDQASLVVNLWNAMEANPKFSELSAEDKATAFVDAYNGLSIEDKNSLISQSGGEAAAGAANSVSSAINAIPSSKTSTITTVYRTIKETISNGISKAKSALGFGVAGTAHLTGTAFAGGSYSDSSWINPKWQTKNSQVALVGEKSQELVVDPSSNTWYTVGDNGAEFRDIPKGAIIFNHKQTENLFKNGHINSRGKGTPDIPGAVAFASGTAYASGGRLPSSSSKASSSSKKKSSKNNSSSKSNSNSDNNSNSSASKETENLVDFIKILYDRVSRLADLAEKAIDRAVGLVSKQAKATDAINKVRTELSTAQQAANKYLEYADKVELDPSYKKKIQEGNLSIENITDENTKDAVSKYQSYYEDYLSYQDKILDLEDKLTDLAEKRLSIIEDEYGAIEDIQKSLQDKLEADRDLLENLGTAIDNSLNTNSIKEAIDSQAKVYDDLTKKLADYQAEVQSQLNSGLMKKGSEQWYNAQKNINDFTANISKASSKLIELQDKLRQISYDTLQNIIDGFSRSTDKIGAYIDLLEAKDERVPETEYQKQLDNNNAAIKNQYDLRNKYLAEQAYYDVNSKRYQELAEKINDADVNILKLQKDNEDLKDSIYSLRIKNLEDAIKGYADLEDELSNFRDLLNDDAFFDKQGGITDEGLAQITLLSQSLGNAKQKISDYTTGLQKIKELYANGAISLDEYNEKTKEYRDGIQDTTKDVKSYQDSLTDLYLNAMQTEVDYLGKIIDKRKKALQAKADYYSYDKKIKSQNKDINSIKAQIQALEGVNNLSAQSQLKKLKAELAEKEEELADTKRDHEYDMRSQGYDAMSDDLKKLIEDTTYDLNHSADKRLEVINSMLDKEVGLYVQAFNKINSIISGTGFVGSTDFNNAQSQMSTQSGASTTKNNATQSQTTSNSKPSSAASGTITSGIKDNSVENNRITEDIMKPENTDHRKVAELNVTRSSVSIQEGSSAYVGASVRPNDAENKNLEWKSSNTGVATVSNGAINGVRPGSCTVTVSTTDGSGLSKSISVTVTKKPEPPKPAHVTNTSGKDGILRVGDTATFSGRYYYDSWGKRPAGSKYSGVTNGVVVDSYTSSEFGGNAKRTGDYKVHIGGADGVYKDLGWVRTDQLSGYKNGIERVPYDQVAEINEGNKDETIITPKGHTLTLLTRNSSVLKNEAQKTLWDIANNPQLFAEKIMNSGFASAHVGSFADSIKGIKMPTVENNNQQNVTVENHYDSLLTVNGNVDKETLPKLQEILKQSCDYTRKEMVKDFEKLGHKIKR